MGGNDSGDEYGGEDGEADGDGGEDGVSGRDAEDDVTSNSKKSWQHPPPSLRCTVYEYYVVWTEIFHDVQIYHEHKR